jgi:AcrR family transcriptional regulator
MTTRKPPIDQRIITAALALIAAKGWAGATLADIAAGAEVSLAQLHRHFPSKTAIIAAWLDQVDDQVLKTVEPASVDEETRDRLFEIIMNRFDVLAPHKQALCAIARGVACDPRGLCALACRLERSMAWMLEAAGIGTSGLAGMARVKGMMVIYGRVLRQWFRDDSEDMAKTMAELDKRLRQAERCARLLPSALPGQVAATS